jgi:hypothetical protein
LEQIKATQEILTKALVIFSGFSELSAQRVREEGLNISEQYKTITLIS